MEATTPSPGRAHITADQSDPAMAAAWFNAFPVKQVVDCSEFIGKKIHEALRHPVLSLRDRLTARHSSECIVNDCWKNVAKHLNKQDLTSLAATDQNLKELLTPLLTSRRALCYCADYTCNVDKPGKVLLPRAFQERCIRQLNASDAPSPLVAKVKDNSTLLLALLKKHTLQRKDLTRAESRMSDPEEAHLSAHSIGLPKIMLKDDVVFDHGQIRGLFSITSALNTTSEAQEPSAIHADVFSHFSHTDPDGSHGVYLHQNGNAVYDLERNLIFRSGADLSAMETWTTGTCDDPDHLIALGTLSDGIIVCHYDPGLMKTHSMRYLDADEHPVFSLVRLSDHLIASVSHKDVRLWDLERPDDEACFGHIEADTAVHANKVSENEIAIIHGKDRNIIELFSTADGRLTHPGRLCSEEPASCAVRLLNGHLAVGCGDNILVWESASESSHPAYILFSENCNSKIISMQLTPSGQILSESINGHRYLWNDQFPSGKDPCNEGNDRILSAKLVDDNLPKKIITNNRSIMVMGLDLHEAAAPTT